ncbi:unnamed protein product [Lactuca virosa]|uniref:Uncharacterized protein n=1 Tax=Lactuca virosa TaxID=75947 RepID=A0AAU9MJ68_9ASTR|nr:unnamed protein product [Lactuca virosa]
MSRLAASAILVADKRDRKVPICFVKRIVEAKKSGLLAKWEVGLVKHEINFKPHTRIKAQELADFITKITGNGEVSATEGPDVKNKDTVQVNEEEWTLHMDGSSCVEGAGVGLILSIPIGKEITYTL